MGYNAPAAPEFYLLPRGEDGAKRRVANESDLFLATFGTNVATTSNSSKDIPMKQLQLVSVVACGALLIGCESTGSAGGGNQERKRLAMIEQQQQEGAQMDEAERNLWNAQRDVLVRDSNPTFPRH